MLPRETWYGVFGVPGSGYAPGGYTDCTPCAMHIVPHPCSSTFLLSVAKMSLPKRSVLCWYNPPFLIFCLSGTLAFRTERQSARMSKNWKRWVRPVWPWTLWSVIIWWFDTTGLDRVKALTLKLVSHPLYKNMLVVFGTLGPPILLTLGFNGTSTSSASTALNRFNPKLKRSSRCNCDLLSFFIFHCWSCSCLPSLL